jgi:hypothetical protein
MRQDRPIDPLILPALLFALALFAVLVGILVATVLWSRRQRRRRSGDAATGGVGGAHGSHDDAGSGRDDADGIATDHPRDSAEPDAHAADVGPGGNADRDACAFVPYLDPETNRVVHIPAAELAPGSVLARIQGHERPVWISAAVLRPSPLRHPPFPEDVREQIRQIQRTFAGVRPMSLEQWEDGFRRDLHPEREIALFLYAGEILARLLEHGVGAGAANREREIYQVLVACMTGSPEHVRHLVGQTALSPLDVQRVVDTFYHGGRGGSGGNAR